MSFHPTAADPIFPSVLPDARANPAAYGATIGLSLSPGLVQPR